MSRLCNFSNKNHFPWQKKKNNIEHNMRYNNLLTCHSVIVVHKIDEYFEENIDTEAEMKKNIHIEKKKFIFINETEKKATHIA